MHFENEVQALFVALMLTNGIVPCLASGPIKEIKLQGKHKGFATDDFIVFLADGESGRGARLLSQIKLGASITSEDPEFSAAIGAALRDFRDRSLFDARTDVIALMTGPLSGVDNSARTILDWARTSTSATDFTSKVEQSQLSSAVKRKKLKAFRDQLKKANGGIPLSEDELWRFLKIYHIVGFDFDARFGLASSLIQSHISQCSSADIPSLWAEIVLEVGAFNRTAGTLNPATISRSILEKFAPRQQATMPANLGAAPVVGTAQSKVLGGDAATAVMYASLLGAWDENVEGDLDITRKLVD